MTPTPITTEELARLRGLAERAAPLYAHPAHVHGSSGHYSNVFHKDFPGKIVAVFYDDQNHDHDADYYAALDPQTVIALLDALSAQKADVESAHAYEYLSRLLTTVRPGCKPLEDLLGLCTQIDALISQLTQAPDALSAQQGKGWRPIAEAPRDGSEFLAIWPDENILVAWWADPTKRDGYAPDAKPGWFSCEVTDQCKELTDMETEPTHWMPLPAPPTQGETT